MTFDRGIDGPEPVGPEPIGRVAGPHEVRRHQSSQRLAVGTLACPACDAPLAPAPGVMSPSDSIDCGFCRHAAAVRDCLSLAEPSRPTRVDVRVVGRARGGGSRSSFGPEASRPQSF